jgi:hypothetical protein
VFVPSCFVVFIICSYACDYESESKYMYLFFNLKYYPDISISETKYLESWNYVRVHSYIKIVGENICVFSSL